MLRHWKPPTYSRLDWGTMWYDFQGWFIQMSFSQPWGFLTVFPQLVSRICHPNNEVFKLLETIIGSVLSIYTQQAVWQIMSAFRSTDPIRAQRCNNILSKVGGGTYRIKTFYQLRGLKPVHFASPPPHPILINVHAMFAYLRRALLQAQLWKASDEKEEDHDQEDAECKLQSEASIGNSIIKGFPLSILQPATRSWESASRGKRTNTILGSCLRNLLRRRRKLYILHY